MMVPSGPIHSSSESGDPDSGLLDEQIGHLVVYLSARVARMTEVIRHVQGWGHGMYIHTHASIDSMGPV